MNPQSCRIHNLVDLGLPLGSKKIDHFIYNSSFVKVTNTNGCDQSDQIVINLEVDLTICEGMSGREKGSNIGKHQCKLEEVV
jgi:hypothetical protein